MSSITETTRTVKVTDFVQEQPPAVIISESVPGPGGHLRMFTQKVQVPNTNLWKKLTAEVKKGETIQATIKTIWPNSGPYYTCLDSFTCINTSATPALATAAA